MSRAFWSAAFAFSVNMLGTTLPSPLYPLYQHAFGLDPLGITLIFASYAATTVVGLMTFGHLSDAIGRKGVLRAALLLSLASALTFILARGVPEIYLGRILSGLSAGIFTGSGTAFLVELAPAARRALAATVAGAVNIGGLGIGTLLSGTLAQYAPWPLRTVYVVDAALIVLALAALAYAPETVAATGRFRLRLQRLRVPPEVRAVFVPAVIAGACSFAVAGVVSSVVPSFLALVLGVHDHLQAGLLIFVLMGATALGQLPVSRFDRSRALVAATAVLLAGTAVLALGVATHREWLLFAAVTVQGFGQGLGIGAGLAEINARLTAARGETGSTYFVILYTGLALPVIGVGVVADIAGLERAAMVFCGVVAAALVAALILELRARKGSAFAG